MKTIKMLFVSLAMLTVVVSRAQAIPVVVLDVFVTDPFPGTAENSPDPEGLEFFFGDVWTADDIVDRIFRYNRPGAVGSSFSTVPYGGLGVPAFTFPATLASGGVNSHNIVGQTAGTPFFAYMDNSASGVDTILGIFDDTDTLIDLDDDNSPLGNGLASALTGSVNADGSIRMRVTGFPDFGFTGGHTESGDYDLFVELNKGASEDPEGLAFDGTNLWVASNEFLEKVDPLTGALLARFDLSATTGGVVTDGEGAAWDGSAIWISDDENVYRINPADGSLLTSFNFPGRNIEGLAWNGTHLLLGDITADEILFMNPLTGVIEVVWDSLPDSPDGLAFDGTDVWFSDENQERIYRINVINVIPEPSTLVLLGIGLAGLAIAARRRKK